MSKIGKQLSSQDDQMMQLKRDQDSLVQQQDKIWN